MNNNINNRSVIDINKMDINIESGKIKKNSTEIKFSLDDNDSKNLNRTTISISKKNNKDGLKDFKENIPIDLNYVINIMSIVLNLLIILEFIIIKKIKLILNKQYETTQKLPKNYFYSYYLNMP